MAGVRLNQDHRHQIREKLINARFDEAYAEMQKEREAFGFQLYQQCYSEGERRTLEGLPPSWVPTTRNIEVVIAGEYVSYPCGCSRPIPYENHRGGAEGQFDARSDVAKAHRKLVDKYDELKKSRTDTRVEIWAVLSSVNTPKQLKETWPEIADVVDAVVGPGPQSKALAVNLESLNERLGFNRNPPE